MKRPHLDRLANGIAAAVSVQAAFLFIPLWGLAGAAISLASGFAVHAAVVYLCFHQAAAKEHEGFASQSAEEITPLEQFNTCPPWSWRTEFGVLAARAAPRRRTPGASLTLPLRFLIADR
jgi:hypothetical protein